MSRKRPVITVAEREKAARLAGLSEDVTLALADVAATVREGLLAMSCAAGLAVMQEIMQAELTQRTGPKGRAPARPGRDPARVDLGFCRAGRTVSDGPSPCTRPPARTRAGEEVRLDSWLVFADRDRLTQLVLERMLAGVPPVAPLPLTP